MEAELLLGVLVLVILWFQRREGMATGVFDASNKMPEPAQVNEIFDQIMSMATPVLQQAYAEALAFAQSTFVDAKALAAKYPEDENLALGINFAKDSAHIVEISKTAVVFGLLTTGNEVKRKSGAITEASLHAAIDPMYTMVTQHINDAAPPGMSSGKAAELGSKVSEYVEKARALAKKYDTPEVRDAIVALLKSYFVDQLAPSPISGAAVAANERVGGTKVDSTVANTQTMYQSSRLRQDVSKMIDDFMGVTPSIRLPTAGSVDSIASKERQKILKVQAMHLYVIQVALLTVLFCILAYWLLPTWAAPMVSLLILATGIGSAIYLSKL